MRPASSCSLDARWVRVYVNWKHQGTSCASKELSLLTMPTADLHNDINDDKENDLSMYFWPLMEDYCWPGWFPCSTPNCFILSFISTRIRRWLRSPPTDDIFC